MHFNLPNPFASGFFVFLCYNWAEVRKVNLFKEELCCWQDWAHVFQSIEAFEPLIKKIFERHRLTFTLIESCLPGTNAVFKVGKYIIKIVPPINTGKDLSEDYFHEVSLLHHFYEEGIKCPQVIASGKVEDRYVFYYLIMEVVEGKTFSSAVHHMNKDEKISFARRLRKITDMMYQSSVDIELKKAPFTGDWHEFPLSFQKEREDYVQTFYQGKSFGYVHGDLNGDNIILNQNHEIVIIDFADSVLAPKEYEWAVIAIELFKLDPDLIKGYFNCEKEDIVEKIILGVCGHPYGHLILKDYFKDVSSIKSIEALRNCLKK